MSIPTFKNLDRLKEVIEEDLNENTISSSRYPVRFIFLNSHNELKDIIDLVTDNSAHLVELSSILHSPTTWFSEDEIIEELKSIKETSVIVPFSEFIRFSRNDRFIKVLNALAEIEDEQVINEDNKVKYKGKKLYIPLVGLWERFEDLFLNKFYRESEWAPIWRLDTPVHQIKIYQVGFDFDDKIKSNNLKLIRNSKEWFELWKTEGIKEIISLVKPVKVYFKNSVPDQTFTQELLDTPKDYLSNIFDMDIDVKFYPQDEKFWIDLLINVSNLNKKNLTLKNIFVEKFNINDINSLNVLDYLNYYLKSPDNSFDRWLVKNTFLDSNKYQNSYLFECFSSLQKLTNRDMVREIFLNIFSLHDSKYLEERRKLLKRLNSLELTFPEDEFGSLFDSLDTTFSDKLSYLTNTTNIEKGKTLDFLQKNGIDNSFSKLKVIFPELYYYLNWNFNLNNQVPSWIKDYFKEYNYSKVYNEKSEHLNELLSEVNSLNNFYDWYYSLSELNLEINEDDYIVWIDALGAEWLPLLTYYLNEFGNINNKKVQAKYIKSVNLPSATPFNKLNNDKKISSLDRYIHDNHYSYPNSLLNELELIKDIAKEISKINVERIVIVSDHGFSFLCSSKFGNYKKYDFKNSMHKGRYAEAGNNNDSENTNDYIFHETESADHNEEKYIVALNHISLYKTPSYEVHGGATPEEVLVPYIVLENIEESIDYIIKPLISEINVSMDTKLPIKISPEPEDLPIAICNNNSLKITKENNEYFVYLNSSLNVGDKVIIKIGDDDKEIDVKIIKGGMESNDDDWF